MRKIHIKTKSKHAGTVIRQGSMSRRKFKIGIDEDSEDLIPILEERGFNTIMAPKGTKDVGVHEFMNQANAKAFFTKNVKDFEKPDLKSSRTYILYAVESQFSYRQKDVGKMFACLLMKTLRNPIISPLNSITVNKEALKKLGCGFLSTKDKKDNQKKGGQKC